MLEKLEMCCTDITLLEEPAEPLLDHTHLRPPGEVEGSPPGWGRKNLPHLLPDLERHGREDEEYVGLEAVQLVCLARTSW